MKILSHEYYTNSSYILKYEDNSIVKEILVEYHFQEIMVHEGYEIHYPVDKAHQEPNEYKYYVHIEKVNLIENEDILEEIYLSTEENKIIEDYIVDIKESEW